MSNDQRSRPGPSDVAALLGSAKGGAGGGQRWGRIAFLLLVAAVGIGALWAASGSLRPRPPSGERPHESGELDRSRLLAPIETRADPRTGEETAPFSGFAISIDTDPPEAVVTVAGALRGEAPVLVNVPCKPGERVEIVAEKGGRSPGRVSTACREDTLVKLTVRLPE